MLPTRPLQFCLAFRRILDTKVREQLTGLSFWQVPSLSWCTQPFLTDPSVSGKPTGHFLHPPRLYAWKLSPYPFLLFLNTKDILRAKKSDNQWRMFRAPLPVFSHLGAGWELHFRDTHTLFMWLTTAKQLAWPRKTQHGPCVWEPQSSGGGRQIQVQTDKGKLKAVSTHRGKVKGDENTREELSGCFSGHQSRT